MAGPGTLALKDISLLSRVRSRSFSPSHGLRLDKTPIGRVSGKTGPASGSLLHGRL